MTRLSTLVALAAQRPVSGQQPPHGTRRWFTMDATPETATVHLYDAIGGWDGISASAFVQQLDTVKSKRIALHINSPGGDVFDAIAIHAALVNHPATVDVAVDGLAASAASFIAMAGDSIGVEKPAKMMIHDAAGLTIGNEADHRAMADLLGQISDTIAGIYADRAGGDVAGWRDAMRAETWYSAVQAVEAGLADQVLNDTAAPVEDRRTQLIRARARVTLGGK